MSEHGGGTDKSPHTNVPRSRLADYAEMTVSSQEHQQRPEREPEPEPEPEPAAPGPQPEQAAEDAEDPEDPDGSEASERRREFAALLGEFRRTPVLVPLGEGPGPDEERGLLITDLNGIRFILAFSDEHALARYATARGEAAREWTYQTILGARLLDVAVPAAGVPCGVALDCADGEDGMVFPPVHGIVPDEVAVDREEGAA